MRSINENRNKLTDTITGLNTYIHDLLWRIQEFGFQQRLLRRLPKRRKRPSTYSRREGN